jgi:signal transduction histidine kinase
VASVRTRITIAYGAATFVALAGLAALFGTERYRAAERDLADRLSNRAALAARLIEQQGVQGTTIDTAFTAGGMLNVRVRLLLDEFRGYYIIVADTSRRPLYWSDPVRRIYYNGYFAPEDTLLTAAQRAVKYTNRQDYDALIGATLGMRESGRPRRVRLSTGEITMSALLPQPYLPGGVATIAIGAGTEPLDQVVSETVSLLLVAGPLLAGLAAIAAWALAGLILRPAADMVSHVAAITDGRSLHRRILLDPDATDELVRLGHTLNDMLARLEASFVALRRFTADASHELRTPLAVIRADVERAMHTGRDAHEHAVALEEALQEVSRMTGLVESLLTLALGDEGRDALTRGEVALEPLVHDVAETAGILGEQARVNVRVPRVEPVTVRGDAERLRQLLLNLVTNAVKYSHEGGLVEISLESRHDEAIITVRDDGIGIAAADLPFIFDRFWRADPARSRSTGGGSGLGLAISQWIAQAHDGRIDVQSRLGRGTTFTVVLPAASEGAGNT